MYLTRIQNHWRKNGIRYDTAVVFFKVVKNMIQPTCLWKILMSVCQIQSLVCVKLNQNLYRERDLKKKKKYFKRCRANLRKRNKTEKTISSIGCTIDDN